MQIAFEPEAMLWRLERNHWLSEGSSEMTSVGEWIQKLLTLVSNLFADKICQLTALNAVCSRQVPQNCLLGPWAEWSTCSTRQFPQLTDICAESLSSGFRWYGLLGLLCDNLGSVRMCDRMAYSTACSLPDALRICFRHMPSLTL